MKPNITFKAQFRVEEPYNVELGIWLTETSFKVNLYVRVAVYHLVKQHGT